MSPDRIAELRRQRALIAQHLAWIDAELAAAGVSQPTTPASPPPLSTDLTNSNPEPEKEPEIDPALQLAHARADEIIEEYRATEALDPESAKRGCLVLFGAVFVLFGATLLAIYYFGYAGR